MTDIVERLRETQKLYEAAGVDGAEGALQAKEAADEIERLRAALEELEDEETTAYWAGYEDGHFQQEGD
ncbi:MAG: hypothetical protein CML68_13545 [Rhodobacteraceae bacterium]|nr:hypothetical protein [Paracoccaceae bacterium]